MAVKRLKGIDPSMLIVAICVGNCVDSRLAVWRAGADACFGGDVPDVELATLLRSLHKRLPQGDLPIKPATGPSWLSVLSPAPQTSAWRLVDCGQWLASPSGQLLPLTTSERIVLARLLAQPGVPLHRDDIAAQAWSGEPNHLSPKPRSIDVLISRLRRKADAHGIYLPLLAVRRWGYMFMGEDSRRLPTETDLTPPRLRANDAPKARRAAAKQVSYDSDPWSAIERWQAKSS